MTREDLTVEDTQEGIEEEVNRTRMTKGQVETESSLKLKEMDEKNMHNLFLKNMAGLIEETKNPSPCSNP